MKENLVKKELQSGRIVVGIKVMELFSLRVPVLLAKAGFQFIIFDTEHGPCDIKTLGNLISICRAWGICPIVKVPRLSYHLIARPLDQGALGILVPMVETRAQAEEAVAITRFPPVGIRGAGLDSTQSDCKDDGTSWAEFMKWANENILLIFQIETKKAMDNLDEILSVPGVDVALLGPMDLAVSLGLGGEASHPRIDACEGELVDVCKRHGVIPGLANSRDLEAVKKWAKKGVQFLWCASEIDLLIRGAKQRVQQVREVID